MIDPAHAALLVRITARVSAGLLAASLLVAARRAGSRNDPRARRAADLALFGAFIVSHTIHFGTVVLLAAASSGANIAARGGWTPMSAVAVVFYAGCGTAFRVKQRPGAWWRDASSRWTEVAVNGALWVVFAAAYLGRWRTFSQGAHGLLFAALAAALVYSFVRFVSTSLRSSPKQAVVV